MKLSRGSLKRNATGLQNVLPRRHQYLAKFIESEIANQSQRRVRRLMKHG